MKGLGTQVPELLGSLQNAGNPPGSSGRPPPPFGSARPSRQPGGGGGEDRGCPHPCRPCHRPPARASQGAALSQAGTLIKTGATPPSPVTPRYPHKLHFICFLFTVSLLIKSVIACLRGHGPRFPTPSDLRVCARGCGCVRVGLSSRPCPAGRLECVRKCVLRECRRVRVLVGTCTDSPAEAGGLLLALELSQKCPSGSS